MNKKFQEYFTRFKDSSTWAEMVNTVEDSPWHREDNVSVHTEMVLDQFFTKFAYKYSEHEVLVGALALLYHDIGKPTAEEELSREDGTVYRRYAGHEPLSANGFVQAYVTDPALRDLLTVEEATAARWIIEHHLPYGVKDRQKRQALRTATHHYMEQAGCSTDLFFDCLRSDAAGRISDDHETKLKSVEDWISEFAEVSILPPQQCNPGLQTHLLMGAAGAGKSTFFKNAVHESHEHTSRLSFDDMKVEFYMGRFPATTLRDIGLYEEAWQYATLGDGAKDFDKFSVQRINSEYARIAKTGGVVFSDTVNSNKKRRGVFIRPARQHKFKISAVDFWVPYDVLVARQSLRGDKNVPAKSIKSQLDAMSLPLLGTEVDSYQVLVQTA